MKSNAVVTNALAWKDKAPFPHPILHFCNASSSQVPKGRGLILQCSLAQSKQQSVLQSDFCVVVVCVDVSFLAPTSPVMIQQTHRKCFSRLFIKNKRKNLKNYHKYQ